VTAHSLAREDFSAGLNQLAGFENKVRAQVLRHWPEQGRALLDRAQSIRTSIARALP
jgi:hypothetical protein